MRQRTMLSLAVLAVLLLAAPASALTVTITGPDYVLVPYGQCAGGTWGTNPSSLEEWDWTWNSQQVGSNSTYYRQWCSPNLDWYTYDSGTLGVYGQSGGYADADTKSIEIHYEGRCGEEIWC